MAKRNKSKTSTDNIAPAKTPSAHSAPPNDAGIYLEKGFWSKNWLPAAFLVVVAMGLYLSSVKYEYVLDDKIVYSENAFVKKGWAGLKEIFTTESFTGYFGEQRDLIEGGRYRPLSIATFAIEYSLTKRPAVDSQGQPVLDEQGKPTFQGNPMIGHLGNILLYALTGLLLFRILCLLFPIRSDDRWYWSIPFIATLLFVVHPVHSEVVANIKGRDEILALMGALGALYFSLLYFQKNNYLYLGLAVFTFFLGLLAKENALTFIAIIPLTAYFFTRADVFKIGVATGVLLLTGFVYLTLRTQTIGFLLNQGGEITDIMNNPFYGLNVGEKFATIFYTLGRYVQLLIFPHPLTHDYYPYHIPVIQFSDIRAIAPLLLYLVMGVFALWGMLKKNVVAYGILFYLITLSIVSNIPFTVGTFMNERFIYMPSIGFCLIVAWLMTYWLPKMKMDILAYGLIALMLVGYAGKTLTRVPAWKNTLTLNQAAIKVSKNSARANCFMGTALFNQYKAETNRTRQLQLLDEVNAYMDRSLEILPDYSSALTMKSGLVAEYHKNDQNHEKLLAEFRSLLLRKSTLPFIRTYMDYLQGRADIDPNLLANWSLLMGKDFLQAGKINSALQWLDFGLKSTPNNPEIFRAIGQVYQAAGDNVKAEEYLRRAGQ